MPQPPAGTARDIVDGIRDGFLFVPIYMPIAVPYAIAAQGVGLEDWQIVLWSALIFAGSAQLACVGAIAVGAGLAELLVITFMANTRHSFIAMAIAPLYGKVSPRWLPVLAFSTSVGTMALLPRRARRGGEIVPYALATQTCQWVQWVAFTALGVWLGPLLPKAWTSVIGFAAAASFIGLLNSMVREDLRRGLAAVLIAAALALALAAVVPPQVAAIVGAIAGSVAALLLPERRHGPHAR